MAAIDDLIRKISDNKLQGAIRKELKRIQRQKKFGLVFEEHLPEATPLYDVPIKKGSLVAKKNTSIDEIYRVLNLKGEEIVCCKKDDDKEYTFKKNEYVVVAPFGEPIYPYLKKIDSVCNAPDDSLWHTLIEADNYHALQMLVYLYSGKVDCIYIDPPYNTGAKDWKYNNDYVDGSDEYRHSKWLSFMEKRLLLAKKLLNPKDSVLICTIDEKEYVHLGCLLEELFPEARIQMVSSVINPAGVSRQGEFARTDEYIYFVFCGCASPQPLKLNEDWRGKIKGGYKDKLRWNGLQRSGTSILRQDRPNMFYPIYIKDGKFMHIGESIPINVNRKSVTAYPGETAIWPIFSDGREGRWRLGRDTLIEYIKKHYVKLGRDNGENTSISYLAQGEQKKVEEGEFPIIGYNKDGSIKVDESLYEAKFIPGTQWWITSHDATQKGTKMLNAIIGSRFKFPKSIYAVHDTLRFFVADKPNALIVDFFAGSGTTLHAVNLLNKEDGGHRRCIMVTNNEVGINEAKELRKKGLQPGDTEWEKYGIARYVCWPRTVCTINGVNVKGEPLKGTYVNTDFLMSDGFKSNCIYFKLGFLDKNSVAIGRQFTELISLLWMKAGCIGKCPEEKYETVPSMLILPENKFAVLTDEMLFAEFKEKLSQYPKIGTVYLITDSESNYLDMIGQLSGVSCYQLYRDYLDNFTINYKQQ